MFNFIWNIFSRETEDMVVLKNALRTLIQRREYLKMKRAAVTIQSHFRYRKVKRDIRRRLRNEGAILIDKQFLLKKKWLMRLRGELFQYISYVDNRLENL